MAFKNNWMVGPDGKLDGSLGLVVRINILWSKVTDNATAGDFNKWDFLLDRVFCELCYEEPFNIKKNTDGEIVDVALNDKDRELFEYLNLKVKEARENLKKAKSKLQYSEAKSKLYKALMMKDVGLRKFHHQVLRSYTKHTDSNPSRAMWGG